MYFFLYIQLFSITKFVVKKNYEYFVLGNNFNKIQNLYYDFVVQRYFKNNFIKQESDIKKIAKITKRYLVDQIESSEYGYDIQPTFYGVSLGQVIILGYGACESVNGVLGIRLSKNFKNIELFALFDDKKNTSPHTLLKYSKKRQ